MQKRESIGKPSPVRSNQIRRIVEAVDDETLMLQVLDGDLDRLNVLFERYSGMLYCYFMKRCRQHSLSEDLTQEVFLRVLRYRKTFKANRSFKNWLFGIARNANKHHWAKKSSWQILSSNPESEIEGELVDERSRPDAEADRGDDAALLYEALEMLSEEKRQLVILRRIQNLDYAEIADILGCEIKLLKVRAHRAVAELAKHVKSLMKEKPYELRGM